MWLTRFGGFFYCLNIWRANVFFWPGLCEKSLIFYLFGIERHLKEGAALTIDTPSHIHANAKVNWLKFSTGNPD